MEKTQNVTTADAGQILTDETAATLLAVEPRTIRDWRTRRGLPFVRITAKVIRIRRGDLDKWLARHQVAITRGAA
jgi:excisionase family DNA binding protein